MMNNARFSREAVQMNMGAFMVCNRLNTLLHSWVTFVHTEEEDAHVCHTTPNSAFSLKSVAAVQGPEPVQL